VAVTGRAGDAFRRLRTQWKVEAYSGLQSRRSSVIAGVLYRDFRRKSDDHGGGGEGTMRKMLLPLATLDLGAERDVVAARQRARQLASLLGFGPQDQSRIATATSEMLDLAKIEAGKITEPRLELLEARDAAEAIDVRYESLPMVADLDDAVAGDDRVGCGIGRRHIRLDAEQPAVGRGFHRG